MSQPSESSIPSLAKRARYLEPFQPLVFPESAQVPETQLHLDLRTLLYLLLSDYLGESYTVGSDQFVYFDASNPRRCVAPDAYFKAVPRGERVRSWKVWERGAPDLAVEIISDSDSMPADWEAKLAEYQAIGVRELVRLDLLTSKGPRLRVWNRIDEGLRERVVEGDIADSLVAEFAWVVAPASGFELALRIASATSPLCLVPTAQEARQIETEARKVEVEARKVEAEARKVEAEARKVAEARVAELEALLKSQNR